MEGASIAEQLIGAARSNNESLIESILKGKTPEEAAQLINTLRDPVGNGLLHLAAHHGSLETLDLLLDQEGVEIDPRNRLMSNTPLHQAVEFARGPGNAVVGQQVVELLIECGAQPNLRNSTGKMPIDIAISAGLMNIVNSLRGAQYAAEMSAGGGASAVDADGPLDEEDGGEPSSDGEVV